MIEQTAMLAARDGAKIFYRWVQPARPRGIVLISHGVNEHSGRYGRVLEFLAGQGWAAFVPDLRGHGRSARVLGDLESLDKVLEDLEAVRQETRRLLPGLPVLVWGFSLGGLFALLYAHRYQQELCGLILCGPSVMLPSYVSPLLVLLSSLIAALFPLLPVQEFDYTRLSRDPEVIRRLKEDPLYYKGKLRSRSGVEILRGMKRVVPLLPGIRLPTLILHGGEDVTVEPASSRLVLEGISSPDKELRLFPGLRHEILNEPEREEVYALIARWLERRVPSP